MTYEQALAFWYGRINYEQRAPKPGDLKLDRMRELLERLGNPHQRLRLIHVAGSKGKGSTAAMLAAILREAGYRTGLFTSPHLTHVEERFQVDGRCISTAEFTQLMNDIRAVTGDGSAVAKVQPPTFFEIATALGFLHFYRKRADVAVIEVGLGGRFDSTNVCQPKLAVITSISFDHTQQLGNSLAAIAMEKAGIVKPGVPTVCGVVADEPRTVIAEICRVRNAPVVFLNRDFHYTYEPGRITNTQDVWPNVQIATNQRTWPMLPLRLLGEHQAANAAVVIAAVEQLQSCGFTISDQAVAVGFATVEWPARMEVLGRRPLVVMDCAHNVASAQALAATLQESFPACRRLLIFAGSSDKDLSGMLRVLAPHFAHVYLTRFGNSPRGVLPEQLADMLQTVSSVPLTTAAPTTQAWRWARSEAGAEDLICVTGSVFLAGDLRPRILAGDA